MDDNIPRPKYCPYCGNQSLEQQETAFVEVGEYLYEKEFDGTIYECQVCGRECICPDDLNTGRLI